MQERMFAPAAAPQVQDCVIVEVDAAEVASVASGARLVHIDPPWTYRSHGVFRGFEGGNAGAIEDHYAPLDLPAIVAHVAATFDAAAPDAYLLLWTTWPQLGEWMAASAALPWRLVTGGSWHKTGRLGIGFHVRGDSEPWLLYVKGKPRPYGALSNAYASERQAHSEKPAAFLRLAIAALTQPGDLVLDVYAGRGPCGVAARQEGRRYVGIEVDHERAEIARASIARAVTP